VSLQCRGGESERETPHPLNPCEHWRKKRKHRGCWASASCVNLRVAISRNRLESSGGRIRTSDLRVMSVFRSKTLTVVTTRTYRDRKALRPSASATHDTPATRVFPLMMYRLMYILGVRRTCKSAFTLLAVAAVSPAIFAR